MEQLNRHCDHLHTHVPILDLSGLKKPYGNTVEEARFENVRLTNELEYKQNYIQELKEDIFDIRASAESNIQVLKSIYKKKEMKWKNSIQKLRLAIE